MKTTAKYLTVKDLVKRYQVTRPTIYKWIKDGAIPSPVKFNATIRWNIDVIEKWEKVVEGK